jgi:dihydrolipoamide dehydrogenase
VTAKKDIVVDVAVLGGGPGGYTAAIRAAQLGASVACVEREAVLGGTCLRVGCIPTKSWVQTALFLKQADETFAKLGVQVEGLQLDFHKANEWKSSVVQQETQGVASLFESNGVQWIRGTGTFLNQHALSVEGAANVTFTSAIVATGSFPLRPPIVGLDSARCVDSEGLLAQAEVPERLVILGGGVIGCEFASIFERFGSRVTVIEGEPSLIPAEDSDAATELQHQFQKRGIELQLSKRCTKVEDGGSELTVHYGDNETVKGDLMLVAVGRGPTVEGLGLENVGVEFDRRTGIVTNKQRRTTAHHIYAVGDCAGHWQLAHTAFREGEVAAQNACGHPSAVDDRAVPRPIFTDPEIASVGLTEAQARDRFGAQCATGVFPWAANARAVMQNERAGWVKSINETVHGKLVGLVMVGPHVTEMVETGVIAIDAGVSVERMANAMAPHPTLSEAIKGAAQVALGRAIDVPARQPTNGTDSEDGTPFEGKMPGDLRYSSEHMWGRFADGHVRIGITDYAQNALGDVTFVRLPAIGTILGAGDVLGEVQSLKSDSEVYSPVAGKVATVNKALSESPELVNDDPYGEGWICELESIGPEPEGGLLDAAAYTNVILGEQRAGAGGSTR